MSSRKEKIAESKKNSSVTSDKDGDESLPTKKESKSKEVSAAVSSGELSTSKTAIKRRLKRQKKTGGGTEPSSVPETLAGDQSD